jgi:hypothetical protein
MCHELQCRPIRQNELTYLKLHRRLRLTHVPDCFTNQMQLKSWQATSTEVSDWCETTAICGQVKSQNVCGVWIGCSHYKSGCVKYIFLLLVAACHTNRYYFVTMQPTEFNLQKFTPPLGCNIIFCMRCYSLTFHDLCVGMDRYEVRKGHPR